MLPWLSLSAVCLLFCQLNVYFFVSWLFTFLSADCLLLSAVCLQFDFSRQNHVFSSVFCQNDVFKLEMSADCLHFQLFVYIFSCLFTFCQLIVYIFSCLFTFVSCLFTIWIFTPKSCFFHQPFVKIMLQSLKSQMFVYIFSCLFTFLSADFAQKSLFFHDFFATMLSLKLWMSVRTFGPFGH